jgi:hypothetical protein
MQTTREQWNVYQHSGSRSQFIVLIDCYPLEGIHILDYWMHGWADIDPDLFGEKEAPCYELWYEIVRCCKQAEKMIAIQPTPERAERVFNQHLDGMATLLVELKERMKKAGVNFALLP